MKKDPKKFDWNTVGLDFGNWEEEKLWAVELPDWSYSKIAPVIVIGACIFAFFRTECRRHVEVR